MRTLNKERPPGDPGKYAEMKQAMRELQHAHRFFLHLKQLGRAAGLDPKKLQHHVEFVVETHDKSLVRGWEGGRMGGAGPGRGWGRGQWGGEQPGTANGTCAWGIVQAKFGQSRLHYEGRARRSGSERAQGPCVQPVYMLSPPNAFRALPAAAEISGGSTA